MPLCWTAGLQEVCFVHLGKYGDIIIMLPAFKAVADELGKPVICLVSADYHPKCPVNESLVRAPDASPQGHVGQV